VLYSPPYAPSPNAQGWPRNLPTWWRVIAWVGLTVYTAVEAVSLWEQITAGLAMAAGAVAMQLTASERARVRTAAVTVATICGYAALLLAPHGIAEALIVVAASRIPNGFSGRAQVVATTVDAIGFAVAIGWVSHSVAGLLSGTAIPLLVQRAAEQKQLVAERDRAQALLAEVQGGREAEAQAAALRERGRIARDLHDVLAHSLAGLSVQLQAVRAVAAREGVGPAVLEPLDKAALLARDGLTEAREAVATLRDPIGLGLDAVPALVERHPGAARLVVSGTPAAVVPEAGHAVYRAVQESLTNAARYAPGSPVQVGLDWAPEQLTVRVDDAGLPLGHTAVAGVGTGLGLAGMDERVQQAGGALHAGPRPDGGWRVEITVPAGPNAVGAGQ
jgi:signal transduction histidine kinase